MKLINKKLCNRNECTGCSACVNVCPKKAITLQYDDRGFLSPVVDEKKCINCNMCTRLCEKLKNHMNDDKRKKSFYKVYACKLKDEKKRMQSQSGGLFTALAETILEENGVVYGAGIDENNHVKHFRITKMEELGILKGSKYVQSDINNSFKMVIKDLQSNKAVLFSGTPCQVAGIESLLDFKKINKEKFYSCDLICHGVPSPKVYENYISFLETRKGDKIKKFNFRDKDVNGWKEHVETYRFENSLDNRIASKLYCELFYSNLILRKSCESCKYASKKRPGDITMADFWGIEKINPELWNDNKGISACLIQTNHGEHLFELAKDKLDVYEIKSKKYTQNNMEHPSYTPYQKDNFWNDYKMLSFEKLLKKYTTYGGIKFKIKRKIYKKLNRW